VVADEPLFILAKTLARLAGEYREVAGRIVTRHDHNRYVLAADRDRLASLNREVEKLGAMLSEERGREASM
jgi:hypothetical protein